MPKAKQIHPEIEGNSPNTAVARHPLIPLHLTNHIVSVVIDAKARTALAKRMYSPDGGREYGAFNINECKAGITPNKNRLATTPYTAKHITHTLIIEIILSNIAQSLLWS